MSLGHVAKRTEYVNVRDIPLLVGNRTREFTTRKGRSSD
jgi:hypothetical protein